MTPVVPAATGAVAETVAVVDTSGAVVTTAAEAAVAETVAGAADTDLVSAVASAAATSRRSYDLTMNTFVLIVCSVYVVVALAGLYLMVAVSNTDSGKDDVGSNHNHGSGGWGGDAGGGGDGGGGGGDGGG